ncbi:MAG: DNA polymerase III subunit gamma/tau [Bacteroidaceae bacterium]|nr:DNA polymerase III subunit gamma/tau [Bacteroidaceae bacterium]
MENYIVSARKYRPDTFETVVAQKSLTTTLKNAIQTGKLAHAYLFCGPRGVGKTTCARIFAKTINCLNPTANGEPCNECESCRSFNEQRSFSIYELDAASNNSVEDIRSLNEQVRIPPQIGKYKVYIIDEVHMLSQAAFNAFLKTLEEPPAHAIFILATTEKHKIIPTILSRCQIYDFSRIDTSDIIKHLQNIAEKESIRSEYDALRIIAQKSDGCMRDALSLFDQMASFTQGDLSYSKVIESLNVLDHEYYFRLTDYILNANTSQALLLFNEILSKGFEGNIFIEGVATHMRDLLVNGDPATAPLFEGSDDLRKRYVSQAAKCNPKMLFRALKLCNNCELNYRTSRNKRLLVELTLIQLSQLTTSDEGEDGGRSPKMLKPIFNNVEQADAKQQTNNTNSAPGTPVAQPVQQASKTIEKPAINAATPAQRIPIQGRPDTLKRNDQTTQGLSGMFRRARTTLEGETTTTGANAPTQPRQTVQVSTQANNAASITTEKLIQAWTSFALELPEKERALAERMKLITPEMNDDSSFTIRVDNQMVAQVFEEQNTKIAAGISRFLQNRVLKMKIEINKVTVQRHVYDRTKQYEILREKNPIIEKLRKGLNLELA